MPLIAVLAGDGIGPEVTAEARRVLEALDLGLTFEEAPVGGAAYLASGRPLPPDTLALAKRADAVLFGAVGDPRFEAQQPGDVHRAARPDPRGFREGERGEARTVQRQLRGGVSQLQRRRCHLHRPGDDGRRQHHL